MNIQDFLREHDISFEVIRHRPTYDAQRMAQAVHVSGTEVAKTVLLRANSGYLYLVAVLPATKHVDLDKVQLVMGGSKLELATEQEISQHCPDCEVGALPPFGSQYGMKTLIEGTLFEDPEIVFEGNSHDEAIRMNLDDYRRLEQPLVASISRQ